VAIRLALDLINVARSEGISRRRDITPAAVTVVVA